MAARTTGFAILASASVQEAHDMALIAQAATLRSRIPFIHFFDGFRTSHEVNKIDLLSDEQIRAMIDDDLVFAHRGRALNPDNPFIRGTAQNPDVYFQGRETVNPFYQAVPSILWEEMSKFADLTGREYAPVKFYGAHDADRVIVMMGSGVETAAETAEYMNLSGENVGVIQISLYRPFPAADFLAAIPASTRQIAVLDRTKESGASGEPLYSDVMVTLMEAVSSGHLASMPAIVGGRYGLSSKEFTPAMAKATFDNLSGKSPKNHFTVGIIDDVGHTSLDVDEALHVGRVRLDPGPVFRIGGRWNGRGK